MRCLLPLSRLLILKKMMMTLNKDTQASIDALIATAKRSGALDIAERVMEALNGDAPDDIKFDDVAMICREILNKQV